MILHDKHDYLRWRRSGGDVKHIYLSRTFIFIWLLQCCFFGDFVWFVFLYFHWQTLLHNVVVPGENHRTVTCHGQTLLHNVVVPGENHRAVTSHWQPLLHNVVWTNPNPVLALVGVRGVKLTHVTHFYVMKVNILLEGFNKDHILPNTKGPINCQ